MINDVTTLIRSLSMSCMKHQLLNKGLVYLKKGRYYPLAPRLNLENPKEEPSFI
jgi:hypothetical protein